MSRGRGGPGPANPYRVTGTVRLFPQPGGRHYARLDARVRAGNRLDVGDEVTVRLVPRERPL